ncbi:Zinc finger CCCH domain-containing protein 3 [Bulinus truncatus]|nr:Zinc finger CCCH domain-containing protein 3 [Bulinus truncatus]
MQKHVWMRVGSKTLKRNTKSLVSIGDHLYQSNKRKLTRIKRPVSSSSLQNITDSHDLYDFKKKTFHKSWRMQKMKLISLQGVHFNVDSKGKKLSRAVFAKSSTPYESKKLDTKRCDENARLAASRAVYRSIAIATAKSKKDNRRSKSQKQHCLFFGRFGKCVRGDSCPYIHDPLKVAVCTRFLRGKCDEAQCPFTHKASINKMPVCDKCKKLHSFVCPTFSFTGTCLRGVNCPMLHRQRQKDQSTNSKSSLTPSEAVEKVPKQSAVKHTNVNCAKSRPIVAQPSYISLTAEQEDMTPASQLKPHKELILKSTSLSSNTSFISLLPSDLTAPVNDLSTRRPGFQSAPASYLLSESTLAKVSTPIVDSLKTTNTSEPVTSLKITPSFLSPL